MADTETDSELMKRAQGDDLDAYTLLMRRYERLVYSICARIVGNHEDARDLAQETFMTVWRKRNVFDLERDFRPWVSGIAANLAKSEARRKYRGDAEISEAANVAQLFADPHARLEARERGAMIGRAMEKLPPDYRAVMTLKYLAEMSYDEIEETLEISKATLETRLFRARRALRQLILEDKEAPTHVHAS